MAFGLSEYLVSRGHEVTVFTTDALNAHNRITYETQVPGVSVTRFRNLSNHLAWNYRIVLSAGLRESVRRTIASYDIVHLHEYRSYQNLVVAAEARAKFVPVIVQAHGSLSIEVGRAVAKRLYDTILGQRVLSGLAGAVALNRTEADLYRMLGIPIDRVGVIANPVGHGITVKRESVAALGDMLGLAPETHVVTYLGRLHKSKGLEILVDAIALLARGDPGCVLLLAGADDGMTVRLKKLADKRGIGAHVRFVGYLEEENRIALIASSNLLVIPKFTGFPVTILEAYSLGVPIVTTTASDHLDWLTEDIACVVPPNPRSLAEAIASLLLNPSRRRDLGTRGRKIVNELFNWETIGRSYENFYLECMHRADGAS